MVSIYLTKSNEVVLVQGRVTKKQAKNRLKAL